MSLSFSSTMTGKVNEAVTKVCVDGDYDYILNTDEQIYIAINPKNGTDVTMEIKKELGIECSQDDTFTSEDLHSIE